MVIWTDRKVDAPPILIEAIFVLESVAPSRLHVDRFLPPTPLRVLVDMGGANCTADFAPDFIQAKTADEEAFRLKQNPEVLQALVPEMLKAARGYAREQKSVLLEAAMTEAHARLDGEAKRLQELSKVNPNVSQEEVRIAEQVIVDVPGILQRRTCGSMRCLDPARA